MSSDLKRFWLDSIGRCSGTTNGDGSTRIAQNEIGFPVQSDTQSDGLLDLLATAQWFDSDLKYKDFFSVFKSLFVKICLLSRFDCHVGREDNDLDFCWNTRKLPNPWWHPGSYDVKIRPLWWYNCLIYRIPSTEGEGQLKKRPEKDDACDYGVWWGRDLRRIVRYQPPDPGAH